MTPDDATIIRQCWIYARLNAKETKYTHEGNGNTFPGQPYFVIAAALQGCGYPSNCGDGLWEIVYEWMCKRSSHYATRTTTPGR